jgi:AhpD family alkylhydroperoxidase
MIDDSHWDGLAKPRVPPARPSELNPLVRPIVWISGRVTGGKPPNIITTLARHPKLFVSWLRFGGRLMPRGRLPRRETELVILRVAWNNRCRYEWDHHVRIGKRAGLTEAEIERVSDGPAAEGWSERERAILTACDETHEARRISDETWAALAADLDEKDLIELTMLIGHYEMLAMALGSLGVQPEATDPAHA